MAETKKATREYNKRVGERIKFFRKLRGLGQTELAKLLGYRSSGTISRIERGEIGMAKATIPKAAKHLGIHPFILTTEEKLSTEELIFLKKLMKVLKEPSKQTEIQKIKYIVDKAFPE